jgi:hypothetical protein
LSTFVCGEAEEAGIKMRLDDSIDDFGWFFWERFRRMREY